MAVNQKFKEYRVNSLPNSNLKAGDKYHLNIGNKYKTYIVSDSLELTSDNGTEFLEKDTMQEMRNLSSREIWALQNNIYKGVKLNGYYEKGDTPAPIEYYLSSTVTPDDGGSVIEVSGIKLVHDFTSEVFGEYFGMEVSNLDNSNIVQKIINYAVINPILKIVLPKYFRIKYEDLNIPNDIQIKSFGNTLEEKEFYNNINVGGTPVNEKELVAGYHMGLVLDVKDSIKPLILESPTKRATSIVRRFNGFGRLQEINSSLGTKWHGLDYVGRANITVTGVATSSGNINIILNGVTYQVPILSGDTSSVILNKLKDFNYSNYWASKTISGSTVSINPPHEVVIVVQNKLTADGVYPVTIDGVVYNVPVLATDSTRDIATKIAETSLIPSEKYIRYSQASCVVIYHIDGEVNKTTSVSANTNVSGITITTNVLTYLNTYNNLTFTPGGRVGIGMWNARQYQLEVANSLRILADSPENNSTSTSAILVLENEASNCYKSFLLNASNELEVRDSTRTGVIFKLSNAGDLTNVKNITISNNYTGNIAYLNRLTFKDKTRFITTNVLGSEDAVYISNNAGTAFTVRISDATGIEVLKGGTWKAVDALATTTNTGLVKQSASSADTATAPSATYTQSEVQAILTELRDLKVKLRTAGILAT